MNKNKQTLYFASILVNVFQDYASKVDLYFKDDKKIEEHKELYNYYQDLIKDIIEIKGNFK